MNRSIGPAIAGLFALLHAGPVMARSTLVCTVTNHLPSRAFFIPGGGNTHIFTTIAGLVEERASGTSLIRPWTIVSDDSAYLLAVGTTAGTDTLMIDRRGNTFVESRPDSQIRGYCQMNDLP